MGRGSISIQGVLEMAKRSKRRARSAMSVGSVSRSSVRTFRPAAVSSPPLFLQSPIKKKLVLTTSQDAYHSRKSGEAARLSQHLQRVAAMPPIAEKRKRVSKLSLAVAPSPDERKSSHKAREVHCKKRPDSKKAAHGKGGSKRFVPWCG